MTNTVDNIDTLLLQRHLLNDTYPISECNQIEFKKSFHINQHSKYRETMCAFLNTNGGHIIYGVLDNCIITGCSLTEVEKDNILLFVDGTFTILKTTLGDNIPKDKIKVRFEEISKNIYVIIISCYKTNDENIYQFLSGDSWIRMNASNMKTKYSKLYSVQDMFMIRNKINKKYEDTINKLKKEYNSCEVDTIITVSNIIDSKMKKEKQIISSNKVKSYVNYLILSTILITNIYLFFGYKKICV